MKTFAEWIDEEAVAANMVGGGKIAGIGIGQDGEPGVGPKAQAKHKKKAVRRRGEGE